MAPGSSTIPQFSAASSPAASPTPTIRRTIAAPRSPSKTPPWGSAPPPPPTASKNSSSRKTPPIFPSTIPGTRTPPHHSRVCNVARHFRGEDFPLERQPISKFAIYLRAAAHAAYAEFECCAPVLNRRGEFSLLHLIAWISLGLAFASAAVIIFDEIKHPQQMWVMNIVWPVTALYFSAIAVWFYFRAGRRMTREAMHTSMHGMHADHRPETPTHAPPKPS